MVSYSTLSRYFGDVKDLDVKEVGRLIGGKVQINTDGNIFTNACALRMSYAFNKAGETILSSDGAVSSGADGKWYLYRVADVMNFVSRVIGGTPIRGSKISDFSGKKGVIIFTGCGWVDATGHVDLFDGSKVEGSDYFGTCSSVELYVLN